MLRYMTAGESHGKGLLAILDGVPSGLKLDEGLINEQLARRMGGYGRGKRMSIEKDRVDLVSGLRKGVTIGSPVGMMIVNKDHKIDDLPPVKCPRPGHADLAGMQKYGFNDARDVLERASARETAARVAIGSVARAILEVFGVRIISHVTMIGGIEARTEGLTADKISGAAAASEVMCADKDASGRMKQEIDRAAEAGDTLGGTFEVIAEGVSPGLGSYTQWDRRIDADLAQAMVSIPSIKAVSIGSGIQQAYWRGSRTHDEIGYDSGEKAFIRPTNNAGGVEGGVTNGSPVLVNAFMKPIATLSSPLGSVNVDTKEAASASVERSDVTAVPACSVIGEAVVAFVLARAFLDKFGGDSMEEVGRNYAAYMEQVRNFRGRS